MPQRQRPAPTVAQRTGEFNSTRRQPARRYCGSLWGMTVRFSHSDHHHAPWRPAPSPLMPSSVSRTLPARSARACDPRPNDSRTGNRRSGAPCGTELPPRACWRHKRSPPRGRRSDRRHGWPDPNKSPSRRPGCLEARPRPSAETACRGLDFPPGTGGFANEPRHPRREGWRRGEPDGASRGSSRRRR